MTDFQSESSRWLAVQCRNPKSASAFVYCVTTTAITCRPTCKARLARRSNVIFHDTYVAAQAAGFRACKRCRPDIEAYDPQADVIAQACRSIEQAGASTMGLGLGELAIKAGLTKSHFHRVFKRVTGVTPRIYAINLRAEKLLGASSNASTPGLSSTGASVSDADFESPSIRVCGKGDEMANLIHKTRDVQDSGATYTGLGRPLDDIDYRSMLSIAKQDNFTKEIEYTIQPWASGYVLIAVTKNGVCWLEAGNSIIELSESLAREFPFANITMSKWPSDFEMEKGEISKYGTFLRIMEALTNPTGKTLDVSFDI